MPGMILPQLIFPLFPQEESIVEFSLLAPRGLALVLEPLTFAQRFEGLTLPARLRIGFLLLIAQLFEAEKFPLKQRSLPAERLLAQ